MRRTRERRLGYMLIALLSTILACPSIASAQATDDLFLLDLLRSDLVGLR